MRNRKQLPWLLILPGVCGRQRQQQEQSAGNGSLGQQRDTAPAAARLLLERHDST